MRADEAHASSSTANGMGARTTSEKFAEGTHDKVFTSSSNYHLCSRAQLCSRCNLIESNSDSACLRGFWMKEPSRNNRFMSNTASSSTAFGSCFCETSDFMAISPILARKPKSSSSPELVANACFLASAALEIAASTSAL
eukprot:CAMPEP_0203885438 /NCGR_PEP_ID=MMETSP0359-20131031/29384_1 /ASSEMBLY_ACC=CAM_ASM_000338 /TAXON_ID=268821 /ORGANISM="Scrippsiella Hangoei, Strain SHTV-5" /LENGTH=139 /DNA_ID=CAMNT_0050806057 /DNA_START=276 /DNA_END=696 /DNA_ORIENTATION=+